MPCQFVLCGGFLGIIGLEARFRRSFAAKDLPDSAAVLRICLIYRQEAAA